MIPTPNNQKERLAYKRRKENESATYGLTEELEEKGYIYRDEGICIPYPNKDDVKYYLKISRSKSKTPELIFQWIEKKDGLKELSIHRSKKLISEPDNSLVKHLIEAANIAGLKLNKDTFEDYISDVKVAINRSSRLEVLKKSDFEFKNPEEESNDEKIKKQERPKIKKFDDYPFTIRQEAQKIIFQGRLFPELIKSISLTHEGNLGLKKQLILIIVSLYIDDPVHTEINADTGVGKTDIITEALKNFPQGYVHVLRNISPKNIYYDRESYGDYNIIVFDDVTLSENIIEVIKELADNNKKVKELKTVYDGKSMTFTLPGKYLVILTYAKANPDEELLNRLYKLNMVITDSKDKSAIKKTIQNNAIINAENNKIIERSREIMQAAIQYMIEEEIKIFNPFVLLFDPTLFSNRNIKSFVSLVKAKSFFHTKELQYVEILDQKIHIGSFEDFKEVSELWTAEKDVQTYKLNDKQIKILDFLPEMTKDEAYEEIEKLLDEYNIAQTVKEKEDVKSKLYSRSNIAQAIGVNKSTVINYLDKSSGTAKTLYDYNLIDRIKFNSEKEKTPYIYYKVKKEDTADEKTLWYLWQIENNIAFSTLNSKIRVLLSLLLLLNISINKRGYVFLKDYCENYSKPIMSNDYNSYYSFIAGAFEEFNPYEHAIVLDEATLEDLNFIAQVWASVDEPFENKKNSTDPNLENSNIPPKTMENTSNDDLTPLSYSNQDLLYDTKPQITTSVTEPNINLSDLDLKICKLLINQNLIYNDIFNKIYTNEDLSVPDGKHYCTMELDQRLYNLSNEKYISSKPNCDGETVYYLNDNLKQILSNEDSKPQK